MGKRNAGIWLKEIAATLSEADPDNAELYASNAESAVAETDAMIADLNKRFETLADKPFAVYHDAYGYLEERFHVHPTVSLLSGEAEQPSPARIARNRKIVLEAGVRLVFAEPQTNTALIKTTFEGMDVAVCEIDPVGANIPAGPKHYWAALRQLGQAMADCGAE